MSKTTTTLPISGYSGTMAGAVGSTYSISNVSIAGSNGASGQWLTSSGSSTQWTSANPWLTSSASGTLQLTGDNADVVVNGTSLKGTLENIQSTLDAVEQRLGLLRPSLELEKEWDELKRLGDEYRALEADIRDKMKVWDILKKT